MSIFSSFTDLFTPPSMRSTNPAANSAAGGNSTPFSWGQLLPPVAAPAPTKAAPPLSALPTTGAVNPTGLFGTNGGLTLNSVGNASLHPSLSSAPVSPTSATPPGGSAVMGTAGSTQSPIPSSLSSYPSGTQTPQNFNVPVNPNGTYNSNYLSPGSLQELLDARKQKESSMMSGNNGLIPSDTLQGQIANQLYQSKLYTPEEQSMIQNGQDLTAQINADKLAQRRKVTQLVTDGSITKEQAKAFTDEANRVSDQHLADLSVQQDSNTARLTALGLIRQNQVGALTSISDLLKGSEVAPGSSVYNPITGVQYQGGGASPSTILSAAQNLKQNDQMTGNIQLNPDGTVNDNYYYSKAQSMFSGGSSGATGSGSTGNMSTGGGSTGPIPQQLQTYLDASGGEYINSERVPAAQQDLMKQLAAQNHIAYLNGGDVSSVQSIDYTKANVQKLGSVVDQILSDGSVGKVSNIIKGKINDFFPTSEIRTAFNANRETAIKQIQSLVAGSGSGFRLTQPEIDQAVSQMPTQSDTLSIAKAKLAWINSFLDTKRSLALYGTVGKQTNAPGLNPTGPGVIQTSAGAVSNSWFH